MKNFTRLFAFCLLLLVAGLEHISAQCTQGVLYGTGTASATCTTVSTVTNTCHFVNEYAKFTGLTIGNTYEIGTNVPGTTTGSTAVTAGDHILTLFDATGAVLAFQSSPTNNLINLTFTATTTEVRAQINTYAGAVCGTSGSYCMYYGLRCLSCAGPGAPACPVLSSPTNNATGVSTLPTLSWASVANAVSYDVYLNADATCSSTPSTLITNVGTTSYTLVSSLSPSTQYRWMVIAKDCAGAALGTCVGNAFCFTTGAAPPANDNCTGANGTPIALTPQANAAACSSPVAATTAGATQTNTNCSSTATNDDVWFTFTAAATSEIIRFENIVTVSGTVTAMGMDSYTTCGGTNSNCNTSLTITSGAAQGTLTGLTIGNTYLLRVWTAGTSNSASFNICVINPPPAPANDECAGALPFTVSPFAACSYTNINTTGATMSTSPTSTCFSSSNNDDVFYTFTTTSAGSYTFSFQNFLQTSGTATQVALQLYSGVSCGALTEITAVCNLGYGSAGSGTVSYTLLASTNYYLRICTAGSANSASFDFCIKAPPPPPSNDDCGNALSVTVNPATTCTSVTSGTVVSATASTGPTSSCGTYDDDVWFSFMATSTVHIVTLQNIAGSVTDMTFQVLNACGAATALVCSDPNTATLSGLTIGATYYIRAATFSSTGGQTTTFDVCVTTPPPPPANDECAGAVAMPSFTVGGAASTINGTTDAATQSLTACSGTADDDVWYSFTTPAGCTSVDISLTNLVAVSGSSVDMMFQVFTACGGTSLLCSDPESATLNGLTAGTTYYVRVYTYFTTSRVTFTLNVAASAAMTLSSDASTQPASSATAGSTNIQIYRLQVTTAGANNPLQMQTINVDMATGSASNVLAAKVYYTTTTTFATTTQFGSTVNNPASTFPVNGSQTLASGSGNYFWIVYDLACSVTGTIDASVPNYVYSSTTKVPSTLNPGTAITPTALAAFNTAADGNWSNPATWACGIPPNGTATPITINHNVTIDVDATINASFTVASGKTLALNANTLNIGTAGSATTQSLTINGTVNIAGGTLNVGTATAITTSNIAIAAGGSMTISNGLVNLGPTGGYKRTFTTTGTGALNVSGGTLNVNGSMSLTNINQTGGDIYVDGNAAGVTGNSVASGTAIIQLSPSTAAGVSMTNGTLTIVDPHASTTASEVLNLSGTFNGPVNVGTPHTIRFGDGTSSTAGGNATNGFRVNTWASTSGMRFGNVIVEGPSGTNRHVTGAFQQPIQGDLTVNSGGEFRISTTYVNGNLIVNSGGTFTSTTLLSFTNSTFVDGSSVSFSAATGAQSVTGTGLFRNLTASPTANLTSLTVNNTSASGLTISSATALTGLGTGSVSGTLTLTAGKVNNSSPLTLGTATGANGTLTGGSATAYITGEFRRWNASGTGTTSRIFPIGSTNSYQPCTINFTGSQTTGGVISALFTAGNPGTSGLPLLDGGITCTDISPSGYWTVERISGAGGTYAADMNASGFTKTDGATVITQFANIRLLKAPTGGAYTSADGTPVAPAGLSSVTRTGCTAFSKFAIGGTAAALPLELASFTGEAKGVMNVLHWETLSEKNVQFHVVERSVDGGNWTEVGRKAGQASSTEPVQYVLEDRLPLAKAYYRLRSVDFDGQESKSNVILLIRKGDRFGITNVFPSPTVDDVTVQFTALQEETVTIRVMDLTGRVVLSQLVDAGQDLNERRLPLNGLQAGVYTVTVTNTEGVSTPVRFVKQ